MPKTNYEPPENYRRSKSVWKLTFLVLLLLAAVTLWVQLNPDDRIVKQSQKQYWASVAVSSTRGSIVDRNNIPLAVAVPAKSFFIDPKFWDPKSADHLIPFFGKATARKFSHQMSGRFRWVARSVSDNKAAPIIAEEMPGLYTMNERIRVYPHGSLAFHVLGFCDIDGYGQAGLELAWNHILFSPPRTRLITRDSSGRTLDVLNSGPEASQNTSGSLKLTLDSKIQQILEWRLSEGAKNTKAKWAAGVCVDPRTGEVLALASWPTLNPNDRKSLKNQEAVRNNVVCRVYEPGSIFKPITMSIAVESGAANSKSTYYCRGIMNLADKTIKEVNKHAHGRENLTQVLMNSCNIGMATMSRGVPRQQAYGMLRQFGFGEKSDIELAGEEQGLLKSPEEWLGTVEGNIFIGQGIAVTPIQEVMAIASIANGGSLLKPYVIDEVRDGEGHVIHKGRRRERCRVMSSSTAAFMRHAMYMVVSEGGGKKAKSDKVRIAGKTGTAQIAAHGGGSGGENDSNYVKGRYVASFTGFWPAENPKYAMLISLGEPQGGLYYGGQISAPVFKSIVEDIVQILPASVSK